MKICFLLWSPDISGGTNVIFEHAIRLAQTHSVEIITSDLIKMEQLDWFPSAKKLVWRTYEDIKDAEYDICFATWWRTVFLLKKVKAKHYAYFVQSIESKFYHENEIVLRNLVELTYSLNLKIITEASWIRDYLEEFYAKKAQLVLNGIRKDYFSDKISPISPRDPNKVRILVEGPLGVWFKNTELAITLANESIVDEVWLLTSTDIATFPRINKLYSRVPITDVGKIYASCDIILKLSTVEGMFGPPLEAFHCGATSITYNVTGYDEYIKHEYNGLVSCSREDSDVVNKINFLVKNKDILNKLKQNALLTASKWPDWDTSSKAFERACEKIYQSEINQNIDVIGRQADLAWEMYEQYIDKPNTSNYTEEKEKFLFKIKSHLKQKYPRTFLFIKRVYFRLKFLSINRR